MKTLKEHEAEIWTRLSKTRIVEYFPNPGECYNSEREKLFSIPAEKRTKEENELLFLIRDQMKREIRRKDLLIAELEVMNCERTKELIELAGLDGYNQWLKDTASYRNIHIVE